MPKSQMRSFQDYDIAVSHRPGPSTALVAGQPLLIPNNGTGPNHPQPYQPNLAGAQPPPFQNINFNYPAPPTASPEIFPAQISLEIKDRRAKQ